MPRTKRDPGLVLCVDDNPDLVKDVRAALLSLAGPEIIVAGDSDNALRLLTMYGDRVKLVIQDMARPPSRCLPPGELRFIPEMLPRRLAWNEGLVFYDHFLAREVASRPCIFYTSMLDDEVIRWINDRPGAHYLPKMDTEDELISIVRVLLAGPGVAQTPSPLLPSVVVSDVMAINDELLAYLAKNPATLHELHHRTFEALVARLFMDLGYEVELTPATRDGGVDIRAVRSDKAGPVLYVVECKHNAPHRPVDVGVVRNLYGVKNIERANVAVLATTSFFTPEALALQRSLGTELTLKDFSDLSSWLGDYASILE